MSNATICWLYKNDINSNPINQTMETINNGTSIIKGHMKILDLSQNTPPENDFLLFIINSVTFYKLDGSIVLYNDPSLNYIKLNISNMSVSSAFLPFIEGNELIASFVMTGDKGDKGDTIKVILVQRDQQDQRGQQDQQDQPDQRDQPDQLDQQEQLDQQDQQEQLDLRDQED
jgi:hypothetical protein